MEESRKKKKKTSLSYRVIKRVQQEFENWSSLGGLNRRVFLMSVTLMSVLGEVGRLRIKM